MGAFDENRRAAGLACWTPFISAGEKERHLPVTTACPEDRWVKTPNELSWKISIKRPTKENRALLFVYEYEYYSYICSSAWGFLTLLFLEHVPWPRTPYFFTNPPKDKTTTTTLCMKGDIFVCNDWHYFCRGSSPTWQYEAFRVRFERVRSCQWTYVRMMIRNYFGLHTGSTVNSNCAIFHFVLFLL